MEIYSGVYIPFNKKQQQRKRMQGGFNLPGKGWEAVEGQRSVTESQIMNNLNWSIEDLLQKISKVTDTYHEKNEADRVEVGSDKELAHSKSYRDVGLSGGRCMEEREGKQYLASFSTQSRSKYSVSQSKENMTAFQNFSQPKTMQKVKPSYLNKGSFNYATSCSLKDIQEPAEVPLKKIHSLFSAESIRQVAESRIISDVEDEGNYGCSLQTSAKELTYSMVEPQEAGHGCAIKLSDFQLGKTVGSGKFGEVYLCKHKKTGHIYAMKKIFKSVIREYKMQSQFALQLKILYYLDHPNIVKLYSHFHDEYHVFLLMEYVEGGQLLVKMGSGQEYVSRVVGQMIDAVEYMHGRGVVHRDIKPENIVLSFDKTVKLCDFGWAGISVPDCMKTTFCGTLDYVSPEMKDRGEYDCKVDIWSIGVLTYELLTKEAPFKEEIAHWKRKGAKRKQQWDWNIVYPPFLSSLAQSFMRNLLKENPEERASLRYCKQHFFIRKYQKCGEVLPCII